MIYDLFVLGFSSSFAWKCSSQKLLEFYNRHITANHLDVGVGTGYFLDKCTFPANSPRIGLLDPNTNSLQVTAKRLERYKPDTFAADILQPITLNVPSFDSAGLGYLLHCLPGTMADKAVVFKNLKPLLNKNGVVFGSTILGQGVRKNAIADFLMKTYNAKGVFSNSKDNLDDLEKILKERFRSCSVRVEGCVALFEGKT